MGKPEGKKPLRKHKSTREDNIKMAFRETGCGDMDWINLTHDRGQ
jgi:hypothetical protein